MGRLKLLETDSPLHVSRDQPTDGASPPVHPPSRSEGSAATAPPARKGPRKDLSNLAPPQVKAEPGPGPGDLPMPEVRGPRCDLPVLLVPALWKELGDLTEQLSKRGQRVSRNALAQAVLQSAMPDAAEAAVNLVRRWRLLRASEEWPFANEPNLERKLRVHMSQREQLDQYARALQTSGVVNGRSMLVNAILYYEGPKDLQDAAARFRCWETMVASL